MRSEGWPAPAKINRFLHIVGRREDGYHLLQTLFQFLDMQDELAFTVRDDGVIRPLYELKGVSVEQDLCVKAARLLQERSGCRLGADIELLKRLPMGGGIGGGSSDAATVLVALNHLWQLELDEDELADIGLMLGADVPVFVRGSAAWAEGVGDLLQPVEIDEPWCLLMIPEVSVSTQEVFTHPELTRDSPVIKIRDFLKRGGRNDCEAVVRNRYAEVDKAMLAVECFAKPCLTGTGACVFALFESRDAAQSACDALSDRQCVVTKVLNRSPLQQRLEGE